MQASVLIPHYNSLDYLSLVLRGLSQQTFTSFEVIICDDGTMASPLAALYDKVSPALRTRISEVRQEDGGFRKGRILNRGIIAARSDYIIVIDQDCIPHARFVEGHLVHREPGCFLGGQRALLGERISKMLVHGSVHVETLNRAVSFLWLCTRFDGCGRVMSGFYLAPPLQALCSLFGRNYDLLGCNMSFWKRDIIAVNGFEEMFETYGYEDLDVQRRFLLYGLRMKRILHAAVCFHLYHACQPTPAESSILYSFLCDINGMMAQVGPFMTTRSNKPDAGDDRWPRLTHVVSQQ